MQALRLPFPPLASRIFVSTGQLKDGPGAFLLTVPSVSRPLLAPDLLG